MSLVSKRIRPVIAPVLAGIAAVAVAASCSTGSTAIAEDANPVAVSSSRVAFESSGRLEAGSVIQPDAPLVLVYSPGSRLERGSQIAVSFPTAVQEEAGDLWSIPVATPGAPGFCRVADDSAGKVEIESCGRAKGGSGRVVLRLIRALEAEENVGICLSGQVPKVVPRQPFRVIELDAGTGRLTRPSDDNLPLPPVTSAPAALIVATLPSDAGTGEAVGLKLAAVDGFGNVDSGYRGTVGLSGSLGGLPQSVDFGEGDSGLKTVGGLAGANPGIVRVQVTAVLARGEAISESNPMRVWAGPPAIRRFVGDAHFHSGSDVASVATDGGDHRGQFVASADAFSYLRDVAYADWGISAEHDTGLNETTWTANQRRVAAEEQRGRFVTLLGYEWTPPRRLGHHVVVFEGPPGPENPLVGASSGRRGGSGAATVAELAAQLRPASKAGHRVLLIPHVMQPFPNGDVERAEYDMPHETWDGPPGSPAGAYVFNDLRRVGEIYSHHNDDFSIDGFRQTKEGRGDSVDQPQMFELGVASPWSYQHAWAAGHRIGVIGGSDNHFGTPGMNNFVATIPHHTGLAIVFAPELTHQAIFGGLYDRRCYATTGARILLDVSVDGLAMGQEAVRPAGSRLPVRVSVAGTSRVESVEVLKFANGDFEVLSGRVTRSGDKDATLELVDAPDESTLYYVRVRQSDGEWAWSSPVWIDVEPRRP